MSELLTEEGGATATAEETAVEAGAEVEATGAAETSTEAPATTAAPSAPQIDWNNLDFWNEIQQRAAQLGYQLAPLEEAAQAAAPEVPQIVDEYGVLNPQALQAFLDQRDQRLIEQIIQRVAPIEQFTQAQRDQMVNSQITSTVQQARAELGYANDLVTDLEITELANRLADEVVRTTPQWQLAANGNQLAGEVIRKAIQTFADRDKAIADKAVEAYKRSLTEGGGSLLDPGIRGAGVEAPREFTDEMEMARNYRFRGA
jgi:hypothetical protein